MGLLFVLAVISYLISIVIGHFLLHEREGYDLSIEKFAVTYDNCGFIGVPLGYALLEISVLSMQPCLSLFFIFSVGHMASCCWIKAVFS